jgi:hypothetical protein
MTLMCPVRHNYSFKLKGAYVTGSSALYSFSGGPGSPGLLLRSVLIIRM